jgi:hypothetical protein
VKAPSNFLSILVSKFKINFATLFGNSLANASGIPGIRTKTAFPISLHHLLTVVELML